MISKDFNLINNDTNNQSGDPKIILIVQPQINKANIANQDMHSEECCPDFSKCYRHWLYMLLIIFGIMVFILFSVGTFMISPIISNYTTSVYPSTIRNIAQNNMPSNNTKDIFVAGDVQSLLKLDFAARMDATLRTVANNKHSPNLNRTVIGKNQDHDYVIGDAKHRKNDEFGIVEKIITSIANRDENNFKNEGYENRGGYVKLEQNDEGANDDNGANVTAVATTLITDKSGTLLHALEVAEINYLD